MDSWFDMTLERFQFFLEFKMNLLAEISAPVMEDILATFERRRVVSGDDDVPVQADVIKEPIVSLGEGLRVLPEIFIDATHAFMEHAYSGLDQGYDLGPRSNNNDGRDDDTYLLYGELTPVGVRQLLALPEVQSALYPPSSPTTSAACFLDLGSGTGKLIFECACLLNSEEKEEEVPLPHSSGWCATTASAAAAAFDNDTVVLVGVKETPATTVTSTRRRAPLVVCRGVELSEQRHCVALAALERAAAMRKKNDDDDVSDLTWPLSITTCVSGGDGVALAVPMCGDFFDPIEGEADVAVCFACALGFDDALTTRLCDRLLTLLVAYGALGCVVLLLRRPQCVANHELFARAVSKRHIHLEASWMHEAPAIVLTFER
jgi:hypothetical protein